ncbi:MAG TPA: type II CAAX endopeptidase family protein [Pyrinomonadaceae bacterium]|nr:type II CAAX endopeptidase family protein [Pyrinomonadaceae bacterium]
MSTPIEPVAPKTYADFAPNDAPPPRDVNPDNPPWNVWGGTGLWLASVALMIVCQALFLVPYLVRQGVSAKDLGEFSTTNPMAVFLQVVSLIPAHLLTLGVAWLIVTRIGKRPFFASLGWEWAGPFTFWRSAGLAVFLLLVGMGVIYLEGNPETPLDKVINSSRATAIAAACLATFTAPLVEEVVYRGVLYSALQRAIGAAWAVVIVLALFALVHVPQYITSLGVIFTILMLSTILTLIRARTGKLLPCFVIHLVFNGIQSLFIVASPYLQRFAPQAPQAPPPDPALALLWLARLAGSQF